METALPRHDVIKMQVRVHSCIGRENAITNEVETRIDGPTWNEETNDTISAVCSW